MTKEKYIDMCEQTGEEFDDTKCPPDFEDFPYLVQLSFSLYNMLSDTFIGGGMSDPIFIGKDLGALPVLFDAYEVESKSQRRDIITYIKFIDSKLKKEAIDKANSRAKQAKAKRGVRSK